VDRARFELAPAEDGGGQPQNGAHPLCYLHHRSQNVSVKSRTKWGFEEASARLDLPRSDAGL